MPVSPARILDVASADRSGTAILSLILLISGVVAGMAFRAGGPTFFVWIAYAPLLFATAPVRTPWTRAITRPLFWSVPYTLIAFGWTAIFHPFARLFVVVVFTVVFVIVPVLLARVATARVADGPIGDALYPWMLGALLVLAEFVRRFWSLPFPYASPAAALARWESLWPIVRFGSEWLLVGVVLAVNVAAADLVACILTAHDSRRRIGSTTKNKRNPPVLVVRILVATVPVVIVAVSSVVSLVDHHAEFDPEIRSDYLVIGIAQSNVSSRESWLDDWDAHMAENALMARELTGADLIVFAEGAIDAAVSLDRPDYVPWSVPLLNRVSTMAQDADAPILIGAIEKAFQGDWEGVFNTALLFDSGGDLVSLYRKRRLAPFGEFNPFPRLWRRGATTLPRLTSALMLDRGSRSGAMALPSGDTIGVMICFESTVPGVARELAAQGGTVLVNISNDGWSADETAMRQHANHSILRALETGRPLVRVSNGGFSFVFDPISGHLYEIPPFSRQARLVHVPRVSVP